MKLGFRSLQKFSLPLGLQILQKKRRNLLLNLGILSIALLSSIYLTGCADGPKVSPCVLDPKNNMAYCAPEEGWEVYERPIVSMDNFVCFSPDDTQELFEWIKRRSKNLNREGKDRLNNFEDILHSLGALK